MHSKTDPDQPLDGLRILVADDEFLIAVTIEETLRDAGSDVVIASTLSEALQVSNEMELSAALLDVRLGRQTTGPVADRLAERGIPFAFYSGQELPDQMRDKYPDAVVLVKPVRHEEFIKVILKTVGR